MDWRDELNFEQVFPSERPANEETDAGRAEAEAFTSKDDRRHRELFGRRPLFHRKSHKVETLTDTDVRTKAGAKPLRHAVAVVGGHGPIIYTPSGGQPGYRLRFRPSVSAVDHQL